jgi:hypothetical protein
VGSGVGVLVAEGWTVLVSVGGTGVAVAVEVGSRVSVGRGAGSMAQAPVSRRSNKVLMLSKVKEHLDLNITNLQKE